MRFKDQVPEDVKSARLNRLNTLQNEISTRLNKNEIGKTREILFLYESNKESGVYYGRTIHFRLVKVAASRDLVGKTLNVKIIEANKTALVGQLL